MHIYERVNEWMNESQLHWLSEGHESKKSLAVALKLVCCIPSLSSLPFSSILVSYVIGCVSCLVCSTWLRNEGHVLPPSSLVGPNNRSTAHRRPSASGSRVGSIFTVGCLSANCHVSSSSKVNLPRVWVLVSVKINPLLLPVGASARSGWGICWRGRSSRQRVRS